MELNVRRLGDVGDDLLLVGVDLGIGRLGELRLALQSLIQNAASDLPGSDASNSGWWPVHGPRILDEPLSEFAARIPTG
jgi:hypothetical protein